MGRLKKLAGNPVVLIVVWIPAIVFLPGEWITIGEAVTDNANLTRIVLGLVGLLAILFATGRIPLGAERAASKPPPPPPALRPGELARKHTTAGRQYGAGNISTALLDLPLREARDAVEAELVRIIDEGTSLRHGSGVHGGSPQAQGIWERKTKQFLATIFGEPERQRFESNQGQKPQSEIEKLEIRIRTLEQLRDDKESWQPLVRDAKLQDAIDERRTYGYGDRILASDTPAEQFAGMALDAEQTAKRSARRFLTELDTIRKTAQGTLESGTWWDVYYAGLPADKWDELSDDFGEAVPHELYEAVAAAYTEADQLNKLNNSYSDRGRRALPLNEIGQGRLERLVGLVDAARDQLRRYCAGES